MQGAKKNRQRCVKERYEPTLGGCNRGDEGKDRKTEGKRRKETSDDEKKEEERERKKDYI